MTDHPPELLAPAGNWECARAAVENGADAIYFGLDRFNARMRADNFTAADLPELLRFLHSRGVRGYLTFNTLVFAGELADAAAYLREVIAAGVDAAIVQDVGVCRLIRQLSPDFPIHASTQMTVSSAAGVAFAQQAGASLVVMARETSIADLAQIRNATEATGEALPLEVFVHGALCVAYSGQCLTSEALGGRSANRGECAQACRMPYDLISDGQQVELGDRRYLLSPQDLCGVAEVADLIRAGVRSFKIEGRLKTPEYVASVTRVYRQAIDNAWTALAGDDIEAARSAAHAVYTAHSYELEMTFSRGLHSGWLRGIDNQQLVHARFGKKRGVLIGVVQRCDSTGVWIAADQPVQAGDGVVFDQGRPQDDEHGGFVHAVTVDTAGGALLHLRFGRDAVALDRVQPGDRVWKTNDPALTRELRRTFEGDQPRYHQPLALTVCGTPGQPLRVTGRDRAGLEATVESGQPLQAAHSRPLDAAVLRAQLGRLGDTPFVLDALSVDLPQPVMLPHSELNRVRRALVHALVAHRESAVRWSLISEAVPGIRLPAIDMAVSQVGPSPTHAPNPTPASARAGSQATHPSADACEIIPLVRHLPQLDAVLAAGCTTIYAEFENPKTHRAAVERVRQHNASGHPVATYWAAPPRIFKTGEEWILRQIQAAQPDGYLVRNHQHLITVAGERCRGDASLNVANPLAAQWFIERYGLERLTASCDLNIGQLLDLLHAAPPPWFEVVVHQHMAMFHMEHCVFCAFMSSGKDYRDCGRPCEKHVVHLRDRVGVEHRLMADAGCRNTLFNGRAQTGAEYAGDLRTAGVRHFRIELLDEDPATVRRLVDSYRAVLAGTEDGAALWRRFRLHNQLGVTRGTLR
jgi:U32 family peptidase